MSRLRLKISYKDDIRRITLSPEEVNFAAMKRITAEIFDLEAESFQVKYFDEDQDLITVGTDHDLREAINVLSTSPDRRGALRMYVRMKGDDTDILQSMLMGSSVSPSMYMSYSPQQVQCGTSSLPTPSFESPSSQRSGLPQISDSVRMGLVNPSPSANDVNRSPLIFPQNPAPNAGSPAQKPVAHVDLSFNPPQEAPKHDFSPSNRLGHLSNAPVHPKAASSTGREISSREVKVEGSKIVKEWVVLNDGDVAWPDNCTVQTEDGQYVNKAPAVPAHCEDEVSLTIELPANQYKTFEFQAVVKGPDNKVITKLSSFQHVVEAPEPKEEKLDAVTKHNLEQLMQMGFERDACITALKEADNVLNDALELLFSTV